MPKVGNSYEADFTDVDYTPVGITSYDHQRIAVYLPDQAAFAPPYPFVVHTAFGNYVTEAGGPQETINGGNYLFEFLERGGAVVFAALTGTFDGAAGPPNPGPPSGTLGRGLFHPPGSALWLDSDRPNAARELGWALQYARRHAGTFGLDPERAAVSGHSAGATAASVIALGEDYADPTRTDHLAESTRVRAAHLWQGQLYWPAYNLETTGAGLDGFNWFPDKNGTIDEDLCPKLADAPDGYLDAASALAFGFSTKLRRHTNGHGVAIYTYQFTVTPPVADLVSADFSFQGTDSDTTGKVPALKFPALAPRHAAEFGILLHRRLREVEREGWHTKNSLLVFDSDTRAALVALAGEAVAAAEVDSVQEVLDLVGRTRFEAGWLLNQLQELPAAAAIATPPVLRETIDVALRVDEGGADIALEGTDLAREGGLETAVLLSLFSDARVEAEELPDGEDDPRGVWFDTERDRFGSRLWLHERAKTDAASIEEIRRAAEDALEWLLREEIADEVLVEAERVALGRLSLRVQLRRSPNGRWSRVWEHVAETAREVAGVTVRILTH